MAFDNSSLKDYVEVKDRILEFYEKYPQAIPDLKAYVVYVLARAQAAELALAFAQLGRPTLLIDADLRKPRQHTLFGIETPGPGLIQAIMHSDSPGLHSVEGFPPLAVLTAGDRTAENPNELLSSGQFQRLVATLRFRFSCIIVDTPRFGAYSDAQIVAAVLGNVLCVHRAGASTFRDTQDMLHDLTSSRATILGSVLNHF